MWQCPLFRGSTLFKTVHAVLQHCDRKITEDYNGLSCKGKAISYSTVQMRGDEVVRNTGGWPLTGSL